MTLVYLAGPIDACTTDQTLLVQEWRSEVKSDIMTRGWTVYDPYQAFRGTPVGAMQRINDEAVMAADVVIALMPPRVPTVGTVLEVRDAVDAGKPVVLVSESPSVTLTRLPGVLVARTPAEAVGLAAGALNGATSCDPAAVEARITGQGPREALAAATGPTPLVFARTWADESSGALLPSRAHPGDAGFDLTCTANVEIDPDSFVDVPCDLAVALPAGVWGFLVGRSSTLRKRGLLVNPGIIDTGYRGPLYAGVWNLTGHTVTVRRGDRLAQLIPMPNLADGLNPTWGSIDQTETARGTNGFGSSGG